MALKIAFFIYDGVAEMDVVGPWEVFTASNSVAGERVNETYTAALTGQPVKGGGGMRIVPDYTLDNMPKADIIVMPGTEGVVELAANNPIIQAVRKAAENCLWVVGVCTGSVALAEAGLLDGRRATTHHFLMDLLKGYKAVKVVENVRFVRDGNIVTSAGVSAGIDMALWLVGQLYGSEHARSAQRILEYYPAPPYSAEV